MVTFQRWACLALVGALAVGCGDDSDTNVDEPRAVEIRFNAVAGTQKVACGLDLVGLGTRSTTARLLDFGVFIHDVKLLRADGTTEVVALDKNEWQNESVALLNFQDKGDSCAGSDRAVRTTVTGMLPRDEEFTGLSFALGVPSQLNHGDATTAEAPLNATNMFWSWQSGYKAVRLDMAPVGGITRPSDPAFAGTNYFFHLGSTNCAGDSTKGEAVSCSRSNQPIIKLAGYDIDTSVVTIDLAPWVAAQDLTVDGGGAPGCMSSEDDPECGGYFAKLGLDLSSGKPAESVAQQVFSLK